MRHNPCLTVQFSGHSSLARSNRGIVFILCRGILRLREVKSLVQEHTVRLWQRSIANIVQDKMWVLKLNLEALPRTGASWRHLEALSLLGRVLELLGHEDAPCDSGESLSCSQVVIWKPLRPGLGKTCSSHQWGWGG